MGRRVHHAAFLFFSDNAASTVAFAVMLLDCELPGLLRSPAPETLGNMLLVRRLRLRHS